jgi:hypothetical protein
MVESEFRSAEPAANLSGSGARVGNRLRSIGAAALVAAVALAVRVPVCNNNPLRSDAADYIRSLRGGWQAAYLDTRSANLAEFWNLSRSPAVTGGHLWHYLYDREDAAALRHFHVPLAFYPHAIASDLFPGSNAVHRIIPALFAALTSALCVLALLRIGVGLLIAAPVGLVVATCPAYVKASTDCSPHTLFMLLALVFLWLWGSYQLSGKIVTLIAAATAFACSAATLELAPTLLLAAAFVAIYSRGSAGFPRAAMFTWRKACVFVGAALLASFVVWPGGWVRGGYVKAYGVFAYQALFKREEMFGEATARGIFERLFQGDPLLLAAGLAALAAAVVFRRYLRSHPVALGLAAYSVITICVNFGNRYKNETYASETLVFLLLLAGVVLHRAVSRLPKRRLSLAVGISGVLVLEVLGRNIWADAKSMPAGRTDQVVPDIVASLRFSLPRGAVVLANQDAEAFSLYIPGHRFEGTENGRTLATQSGEPWDAADCALLNPRLLGDAVMQDVSRKYARVRAFGPAESRDHRVLFCRSSLVSASAESRDITNFSIAPPRTR